MTVDARGNPHEVARRGDFLVSTDPAQLDVPLIHEFLSQHSYWAAGIPLAVVRKSIENAFCFGLYHQGRQIGFARLVTDRATFAYLGDVFVVESAAVRGCRNGSSSASWATPICRGCVASCSARAMPHGLYRQFGFTPIASPERFMEIFSPEIYQERRDG